MNDSHASRARSSEEVDIRLLRFRRGTESVTANAAPACWARLGGGLPALFFRRLPQTQTSRYVTGVNKTTNAATLTYDPWGGVRLDEALLRMERASARTMAEEMAARWCGKKEGLGCGAAKSILGGVVPRGGLRGLSECLYE